MTDREKIIYDILCSDEQPPEGQHWEGFVTNKIVAALAQPEPKPVAWKDKYGAVIPHSHKLFKPELFVDYTIPLYTVPLQQPEQEPVAWITGGGKGELWWHQSEKFDTEGNLIGKNQDDIPLYTAPPQREWQGLTDEELLDIADMAYANDLELLQTLQAKLKEKNHG